MSTTEPEFPRPSVGDELLVVQGASKYREQKIDRVRVERVARFKIEVEPLEEQRGWYVRDFDLRTRYPWDNTPPAKRVGSGPNIRLHTPETWAWQQRMSAAEKYLTEQSVSLWQLRGSLSKAAKADTIGFANALRRFEGLEEI